MIYPIVVMLILTASSMASLFTDNKDYQVNMWDAFKSQYSREYPTREEEIQRFDYFLENLKLIDNRNFMEMKAGGHAVHGVTRFSDLSQAEFENRYLQAHPSKHGIDHFGMDDVHYPPEANVGLVDWSGKLRCMLGIFCCRAN